MADALIDERRKLQKAVAFMIHGCMARPFHAWADWAAEQVQERRLAATLLLQSCWPGRYARLLVFKARVLARYKQERTVEEVVSLPVVHLQDFDKALRGTTLLGVLFTAPWDDARSHVVEARRHLRETGALLNRQEARFVEADVTELGTPLCTACANARRHVLFCEDCRRVFCSQCYSYHHSRPRRAAPLPAVIAPPLPTHGPSLKSRTAHFAYPVEEQWSVGRHLDITAFHTYALLHECHLWVLRWPYEVRETHGFCLRIIS